jgi:hypothetical protein
VSLPITARQLNALRALQRVNPDLGELATAVALAFDASKVDNPHLARLILEHIPATFEARANSHGGVLDTYSLRFWIQS